MATHRYWCGECSFKTPWRSEPEGQHQQIEHYALKHPGVPPGGQVEARRRGSVRAHGRLLLAATAAVALALLAAMAACRY
ncbi:MULTISPECIES: hypothetical protein [unclassified Streptomyces]|uniref:hypothetical protein n=1 Tax=unclassified Streptomyces TaxID=2593676 RepID=UPI003332CD9F